MIAKQYRLSEKEVKKVLRERKAFFSEHIIANILPNTLGYCRIGIILSAKSAPGSVNRNALRRHIYDLSRSFLDLWSYDIVFFGKRWVVFEKKRKEHLSRDILFILRSLKKRG